MSNILWCFTPRLALIPSADDGICCVSKEAGERFVPLWPHTWTDAAVRTNGASW